MTLTLPAEFHQWMADRQSVVSHRQLLVIHGNRNWAESCARQIINQYPVKTYAAVGLPHTLEGKTDINNRSYRQFLGQEFDRLIYNAFEGFRANAVMALSGTVKTKGLMILLCPALNEWSEYRDPEVQNRTSYGYPANAQPSHFIQWISSQILSDDQVAKLSPHDFSAKVVSSAVPAVEKLHPYKTLQQKDAVEGIIKVLTGHRNRPLVITADRGRGKSSSLGLAAGMLAREGKKRRILLTAPRFSAVEKVFEHAQAVCPGLQLATPQKLYNDDVTIAFEATDAIVEQHFEADILLIDEAAAIPNEILKNLLSKYSRVVFSTTIHGYEGSGRGFEIRFKHHLQQCYPGWKSLHLDSPIRWFQGDCLENFWFDAMLMSTPRQQRSNTLQVDLTSLTFRQLPKTELLNDPDLLAQLFQLLVNAHYQTEQDDLNRLLDGEDSLIFAGFSGPQLLCVALLSKEGGNILSEVAQQVSEGERRPNGHLLAQNLGYNFAQPALATMHYLRVVRIAVLPEYQKHTIGSQLIGAIRHYATLQKFDFLGTSFGLTSKLYRFWYCNHFKAVRVGFKKDTSSGEHNAIMLSPLSKSAQTCLVEMTDSFFDELLFHSQRKLQHLPAETLLMLLSNTNGQRQRLAQQQHTLVSQFSQGKRPSHSCERAIYGFTVEVVKKVDANPKNEEYLLLLVATVLQQRSMEFLKQRFQLTGKKQLESALQKATKALQAQLLSQ